MASITCSGTWGAATTGDELSEQDGLPAWAVISNAGASQITGGASQITGEVQLESYDQRRRPPFRLVTRIGALLVAVGVGFGIAQFVDDGLLSRLGLTTTSADDASGGQVAGDQGGVEGQNGGGTGDGQLVPTTDPPEVMVAETVVAPEPVPEELDLVIADNQLTLHAVVADPAIVSQLEAAVADAAGSFGSSKVVVEATEPPSPWIDAIPGVVALFAQMVDGSITVGPDKVVVTGRAASQESLDALVASLSPSEGFASLTNEVELVDLTPAAVRVTVSGGELTLSGIVPSPDVKQDLVAAMIDLYREDGVVDELEIDDATFAGFDLVRLAEVVAVLEPGGDFSFEIIDGAVVAVLADAVSFQEAESVLTPESRRLMSGVAEIIIRMNSTVTIVGHTDDIGTDEDNLALSEERATAVADYLVTEGVDQATVTALGKGESEPVTSNDTEPGRERNRRVEITFETAP